MLGCGDSSTRLRALEPQFPLMLALMEIAEGWNDIGSFQGLPDSVTGRNLRAVFGEAKSGVGPQICGELLGVHLVHIQRIGLERRVCGFESRPYLFPRKGLLSRHMGRCDSHRQGCRTARQK